MMDSRIRGNDKGGAKKMFLDRPLRILIADDDEELLFSLEKMLAKKNYEVVKAYNGLECFPLIRETEPDLILLDLKMPYVTGEEVIEALSKKKDFPIPIIVISGDDNFKTKLYALENGAIDYLIKPFSSADLFGKIHSLLKMGGIA